MKKHGQITYELSGEEYDRIKIYLNYINEFLNGSEFYKDDALNGIYQLTRIFENE